MTTAEVFTLLEHENCYLVGGITLWWWQGEQGRILGRNFSRREESSKFSAGQKDSPPIPSVEETLEIESFVSILATIVYLYNCIIFHNCIFGI